jgi:hypothetical protein
MLADTGELAAIDGSASERPNRGGRGPVASASVRAERLRQTEPCGVVYHAIPGEQHRADNVLRVRTAI